MEKLVKIEKQNGNQVVNARELHAFLEIDSKFADWIKNRIKEYGFAENEDFEVFLKNKKNPKGGRSTKEYAVTLDMAKELSMVERNEKGRQARKYFIEIEKASRNNPLFGLDRINLAGTDYYEIYQAVDKMGAKINASQIGGYKSGHKPEFASFNGKHYITSNFVFYLQISMRYRKVKKALKKGSDLEQLSINF